jgi:ADP-ribose pyrophosphatase YjhB (NUDIX family)
LHIPGIATDTAALLRFGQTAMGLAGTAASAADGLYHRSPSSFHAPSPSPNGGQPAREPGSMRVNVHAIIWLDGKLIVKPDRRMGQLRFSLPGGRVKEREQLTQALVREVEEEVGLAVEPSGLLYVAEASTPNRVNSTILVFAAEPVAGPPAELGSIDPDAPPPEPFLPPILDAIARDSRDGWRQSPRWLGNIWDPDLER